MSDIIKRIASILDPTQRSAEPHGGDIGHNRMFLEPSSIDEEKRTARFTCSTCNVDRYGEIVEPKAFAKWLPVFMQNPVLLAGHAYIGPAGEPTTIGHWLDLEITEDGLVGTAQFMADDPSGLADAYWHRYLNKAQRAVSVGWITHAFAMQERDLNGERQLVRVFTEVELVEISAVAIPANRESLVRAASASHQQNTESPADEKAIAAVVERVLREKLDASPGGYLACLLSDVIAATRSPNGFGDQFDDIDDRDTVPERASEAQGDNELKNELRDALASTG